ncbi:MAG: hypothetical protein Sylvanvirus5_14 [Sylvanvirus sp.]|uniref:Uncharacterized protein n=1 Tax=Sylvanvirus sp. TaxID=2487774 RepID=A0A3G5AHL9_9VIRU|nr:MAG: hypothetical protein Sylvanvirus5_14 [Sylvanvirus sp.]
MIVCLLEFDQSHSGVYIHNKWPSCLEKKPKSSNFGWLFLASICLCNHNKWHYRPHF